MIGDVQSLGATFGVIFDAVGKIPLVNDDIYIECFGESHNLHVVSIGTSFGHSIKMSLEDGINIGGRRCLGLGGKCACILPLRITPSTTTRVDLEKVFEGVTVGPHVFNGSLAEFLVFGLVSVELIGKSMEKAVA